MEISNCTGLKKKNEVMIGSKSQREKGLIQASTEGKGGQASKLYILERKGDMLVAVDAHHEKKKGEHQFSTL